MATQTPQILRLMDNARMYLPGALDDALRLELFNTLDSFLQDTKYWQEDIDYTVATDRDSYEISGTEDGAIVELLSNVNSSGTDVGATMGTMGTLVLASLPGKVEVYTATVAYTVVDPVGSDGYPKFPEDLLLKYGAGITAGVVGRMMSQPAKPYTNAQMAVFNLRKFSSAAATARADVLHRNVYAAQAWRFPVFAAGRQRR